MEKPAWMTQELWDDEMAFAPIVDAFIRAQLDGMVGRVDTEMMNLQGTSPLRALLDDVACPVCECVGFDCGAHDA